MGKDTKTLAVGSLKVEWYVKRHENTLKSGVILPNEQFAIAIRDYVNEHMGNYSCVLLSCN